MNIAESFHRVTNPDFRKKLDRDKILDLSAALAFYTALSLAPLLILLITFVSILGEDFKVSLIQQVQDLVGEKASEAIRAITNQADETPTLRNWAGIAGIITLLFSAGGIFGQLRLSLNIIFEVPDESSPSSSGFIHSVIDFLKNKLFSMGMVLTFVFISIVSLVASSVISLILSGTIELLAQVGNLLISLLVFTFLFAAIYFFLPQRKISGRVAFVAGFLTAILFSIGKSLIGLYLGQSAVASMYGAAGSLIVLLMWVYFSSIIIFVSAEVANEINKT